jgi:hypothetical protein
MNQIKLTEVILVISKVIKTDMKVRNKKLNIGISVLAEWLIIDIITTLNTKYYVLKLNLDYKSIPEEDSESEDEKDSESEDEEDSESQDKEPVGFSEGFSELNNIIVDKKQ